jgi:cation transport regulator ChaC
MKSKRKTRKETMEYWGDKIDSEARKTYIDEDHGLSPGVIEYLKNLATKLQKMRVDYIDMYHKEPELTDFEKGLIDKYC